MVSERKTAVSKPERLRRTIRRKIRSGELSAGDQLPAERKLADECGFSRVTVRVALDELVAEGILERRHGSGTFVSASVESSPAKSTIHLVCHSVHDDFGMNCFLSEFIGGLTAELSAREQSLIVTNMAEGSHFRDHPTFPELISQKGNLIYVSYAPDLDEVLKLCAADIPAVIVGVGGPGTEGLLPTLEFDMEQGAYDATKSLIRLGHERIVLSNGPMCFSFCQQIERGYRRAFADRDLGVHEELLIETVGWEMDAGRTAMRELLDTDVEFSAVLSYGDWSTFGMVEPLVKAGYTLGRDMAFAMVDYYPWLGRVMPVPVSAVHMDRALLARQALEILGRYEKGATAVAEINRLVPTSFVERISSRVGGPGLLVGTGD